VKDNPRAFARSDARTRMADQAEGWPTSVVVFAVGASIVALNLVLWLSGEGPGRSGLSRIAGPAVAVTTVVVAVRTSRRAGRVSGLFALLLGALVASVAVGDAGLHLAKGGLSETSLTGLASIAAGLTLLGLGAVLLLSGVRGWRRLLAVPAAGLLYFYVMSPLTVAVYVTHVPPTPVSGRTPADLGLSYREVTMRTGDGIDLTGWYVPSTNGAAVVVLHGSGSNRADMIDHTAVLARQGYGVLALDARGHGDSGGVAMDLGWYGPLDVIAAVDFLGRQPEVHRNRIGVLGVSAGAVSALTAAASDPRIGAVVSEGAGVATLPDALSLEPGQWLSVPFFAVRHMAVDVMSNASQPPPITEAMGAIGPRPVLLIAGSGTTERSLNRIYQAAGGATTELWEIPEVPHSKAIWTVREDWTERVVGFLDRALLD
jgi:uncharacterized protein